MIQIVLEMQLFKIQMFDILRKVLELQNNYERDPSFSYTQVYTFSTSHSGVGTEK